MARGDLTVFNEAKKNISGLIDLGDTTDFKCMLITTIPIVAATTPDSADFTEATAGGGYTAGGEAMTVSWTESAGTAVFDSSDVAWTSAAGSPTNIKAALIYSTTVVGEDALAFIDLTSDGSTAISLVDGNITITFNASGLFDIA